MTATDPRSDPVVASSPPPSPGRLGRFLRKAFDKLLPLVALAVLLVIWEGAVIVFDLPLWRLPAPSAVVDVLIEQRDTLRGHFQTTMWETILGFLTAVAIGIPLAIAIVYSRLLERTIYPMLVAMQSVPKVAVAPILVLWLGFGFAPKIVLIVLIAVFPIVISTATGLKSSPREFTEMVESLSASQFQIFRKVRFPAALPHIFVGLKVAISLAVIGAVIGEFVGSNKGLGFIIVISQGNVRTDIAFASMFLLAVLSIGLFYAIVALEHVLVPWAGDEEA